MTSRSLPAIFACGCALAVFAAGCASPAAPAPPETANEPAAEQARREERLKIMQQYWQEHTGGDDRDTEAGRETAPALAYPAGNYSGLNFGPRLSPDASLAEPNR